MKILQVSAKMAYGGLPLHVLTLSRKLRSRGHQVEVLAMSPGPLLSEFAAEGIRVSTIPLPGERIGRNPLLAARSYAFTRKLVRESGFDVVHTHGPSAHLLAGLAARGAGRPVSVASVHGSFRQFASGHVAEAGIWQRGLKMAQYGAIDAISGRIADCMVAVCSRTADELAHDLRVPRDRIRVVHNGIDEQSVSPDQIAKIRREFRLRVGQPLIAFVGRVAFHKGCTFLIDAMREIAAASPETRLIMVGNGPLEGSLKRASATDRLAGKVLWAGSRPDAVAIVAAADMMVLPSLSEGLPLTLLESAMLGRAMVASDVGGIPDIVRPGSTGLLVKPRDPHAIARAALDLLRDTEQRRDMGANARTMWEEEYTADRMAKRMESLYLDLLSAKAGEGRPA